MEKDFGIQLCLNFELCSLDLLIADEHYQLQGSSIPLGSRKKPG